MEIKKIGTLYLNGHPCAPGTEYKYGYIFFRDTIPGKSILKVFGRDIVGKLVDFSDYDLVMKPVPWYTSIEGCRWANKDHGRIIIDRTSVNWMQEVG